MLINTSRLNTCTCSMHVHVQITWIGRTAFVIAKND